MRSVEFGPRTVQRKHVLISLHTHISVLDELHKGFNDTVVNRVLPPLLGGSVDMTLTVILINVLTRKGNNFKVAGNHAYEETDDIYSVQSSLKSYHLWITLYL